jgi:hypothetical protein
MASSEPVGPKRTAAITALIPLEELQYPWHDSVVAQVAWTAPDEHGRCQTCILGSRYAFPITFLRLLQSRKTHLAETSVSKQTATAIFKNKVGFWAHPERQPILKWFVSDKEKRGPPPPAEERENDEVQEEKGPQQKKQKGSSSPRYTPKIADAVAQRVLALECSVDNMFSQLNDIDNRNAPQWNRIVALERKESQLAARLTTMETKLGNMTLRLEAVESKAAQDAERLRAEMVLIINALDQKMVNVVQRLVDFAQESEARSLQLLATLAGAQTRPATGTPSTGSDSSLTSDYLQPAGAQNRL